MTDEKKNSKSKYYALITALTVLAVICIKYFSVQPIRSNTALESKKQIPTIPKPESESEKILTKDDLVAKAKHEVSLEYDRLTRKSVYYPDTPLEAYLKHIELAESGDLDSQYIIYKIAELCGDYPYSQEVLDQLKEGSDHMRFYNYAMSFNDECTEVTRNTEINSQSKKQWYKKLIENKHPVAIIKDLIAVGAKSKILNSEKFSEFIPGLMGRELLIESLRVPQNRNEAISQISTYLNIHHEYDMVNEARTWNIASCINREECTSREHRQVYVDSLIRSGLQTYQIDEIFEQAENYLELIENEEWDLILNRLKDL